VCRKIDGIINVEQAAFVRGVALLFYLPRRVLPDVEVGSEPLVKNLCSQNVELWKLVLACRDVNKNREIIDPEARKYLSVLFGIPLKHAGIRCLCLDPYPDLMGILPS
jgi:hypothetical protein